MQAKQPGEAPVFVVKDCALISLTIGRRVSTHREFRDALLNVSAESIYHHFWGGLLQARFEEREYNNDFAVWLHDDLHDDVLAERMAMLDPVDHPDINTLRQEMIELIDQRFEEAEHLNWLRASRSFEFVRSKIVVFDTKRRIEHPRELADAIGGFTLSSVFYHFIDARRRIDDHSDDFRAWFTAFSEDYGELANALAAVDPYFVSLEELREQLVEVFRSHSVSSGGGA